MSYGKISCLRCAEEFDEHKRQPLCKVKGPSSCPISAGTAPVLPPELFEVVQLYHLLSHELAHELPGLQSVIIERYLGNHTQEMYDYIFRMLFAYHEIQKDIRNQVKAQQQTVESKGKEPTERM